jgi:hypothetical protein
MKMITASVGICLMAATSLSNAATCHADLQSSTPTERFTTTSEIVTDKDTTLSWTRCAIGQHWGGNACVGEATSMNWSEAMAMVNLFNQHGLAGHKDWRLPAIPELASIVERQCFNPRVNEVVFPGAPSKVFWTSMEKVGTTDLAYSLDFGGGNAKATLKDFKGAVRLVRGGPWWEPPKMMSAK